MKMKDENWADRPQHLYADHALMCHTLLLVRAIRDSRPAGRSIEAAPEPAGWRWPATAFIAAIAAFLQRRSTRRPGTLDRDGLRVGAWAMRAANGSGFGGAEAANDGLLHRGLGRQT